MKAATKSGITVRVLQPQSVDLGFDDVLVNHPGQGVMWYRDDTYNERDACHGGFDYGVATNLCLMLESRLGIAVLVNSDADRAFTAIYEVRDLLFEQGQQIIGNTPAPPRLPPGVPPPPAGGGGQVSFFFLFLLLSALASARANQRIVVRTLE